MKIFAMIFCLAIPMQSFACLSKAIDGVWSGTVGDSYGGVFVCNFTMTKGRFSGSCYDLANDYTWPVLDGTYTHSGQCVYEVYFSLAGAEHGGAISIDRKKKLAGTGVLLNLVTGWPAQSNFVRKR